MAPIGLYARLCHAFLVIVLFYYFISYFFIEIMTICSTRSSSLVTLARPPRLHHLLYELLIALFNTLHHTFGTSFPFTLSTSPTSDFSLSASITSLLHLLFHNSLSLSPPS